MCDPFLPILYTRYIAFSQCIQMFLLFHIFIAFILSVISNVPCIQYMIPVFRITVAISDCLYVLLISSIERSACLFYVFDGWQAIHLICCVFYGWQAIHLICYTLFFLTCLFVGWALIYFVLFLCPKCYFYFCIPKMFRNFPCFLLIICKDGPFLPSCVVNLCFRWFRCLALNSLLYSFFCEVSHMIVSSFSLLL
jgi:hypothetical protein